MGPAAHKMHESPSFEPGKPRQWTGIQILYASGLFPAYDLAPDGKRIVAYSAPEASAGGEKGNLHLAFLLNLSDELKRKGAVGRGN